MDGFGGDPLQGLLKSPAICLHRTAEVTLTGVGIHAATGGDGSEGVLRSGVV